VKKLGRAFLVLTAALLASLALVASAAGTSTTTSRVKHVAGPITALAMDGSRIAYGVHPSSTKDRVVVWNVRGGKAEKVSGVHTQRDGDSSTGSGVFQVAIAGTRVAWLTNVGGNTEGDDYLFASSVASPKEHRVASEIRIGDGCPGRSQGRCAGQWLGGLVGSGNLLAANRWTTDSDGAVTAGQLDLLSGSKLKKVATGTDTVEAAVADGGRVAVLLRADRNVALYSAAGKLLLTVDTPPSAEAVALQGERLVVGTKTQQLLIYDTRTGSLRKSLPAHGQAREAPRNLDVQGNVAVYTTATVGVLHAVNLSTGKDRTIAEPHGGVALAQIDKTGLAYAGNGSGTNYGKGTLVFMPLARVTAAVR
jgi:PQQ-like domain